MGALWFAMPALRCDRATPGGGGWTDGPVVIVVEAALDECPGCVVVVPARLTSSPSTPMRAEVR